MPDLSLFYWLGGEVSVIFSSFIYLRGRRRLMSVYVLFLSVRFAEVLWEFDHTDFSF